MDYTELPDVSEIPSRLLTQDEMAVVLIFRKDGSTPDADITAASTVFWSNLQGLINALNADPDHSYLASRGIDVDIEQQDTSMASLGWFLANVVNQPTGEGEPEGPTNEPEGPTNEPAEAPVDTPPSEPTEAPVDTPPAPVEGDQPVGFNPPTDEPVNATPESPEEALANSNTFQPPTDEQAGLSHGGIGDIAN
jgi:hypothetical protein